MGVHGTQGRGEKSGQFGVAVGDDVEVPRDVGPLLFQAADGLNAADVIATEDARDVAPAKLIEPNLPGPFEDQGVEAGAG